MVSLKSDYEDTWGALGPVAVTPLLPSRNIQLSLPAAGRSVIIFCLHVSEGHLHIKPAFFLQVLNTHCLKLSCLVRRIRIPPLASSHPSSTQFQLDWQRCCRTCSLLSLHALAEIALPAELCFQAP